MPRGAMDWDRLTKQDLLARTRQRSIDAGVNVVKTYLDELQEYPQLKHLEMVELFQAYEAGCTRDVETSEVTVRTAEASRIRDRLAVCNLRLVVSIAKQYRGHNVPIEDIIQEGNIGLLKAIDRFKWEKGFRFSTYATWWIRQAIGQHILQRKRLIRLPAHAAMVQRKMFQASEKYHDEMGCEATMEELLEIVGASKTVVKATQHSGRGTISLQQPSHNSHSNDMGTLEDNFEDIRPGCNPFDNVAEKQLLDIASAVMHSLTPKEAAILRLRFGLVEDPTNSMDYPITEKEVRSVMQGKGLK